MGDWSTAVECGRLEELATLARSLKEPLLQVSEGNIGRLKLRVEGHHYLVTRCPKAGIRVCRLGLEELPRSKRFRQALAEFFSHQLLDFIRLRGVGTRARKIARTVETWTRFPDGTENTTAPPAFIVGEVTVSAAGKQVKVSRADYFDEHLQNHCMRQVRAMPLPKRSAPLTEHDQVLRNQIALRAFPQAAQSRQESRDLVFDDAICEEAVRAAFAQAAVGPEHSDIDPLICMLKTIAGNSDRPRDIAVDGPMLARTRLLLLSHAISTKVSSDLQPIQRSPSEALAVANMLASGTAFADIGASSAAARDCWHAARRLARCEIGFRLLCEFAVEPARLHQWQAALRIYLQAADHLIAAPCVDDGLHDARARGAWTGSPLEAAQYAAAMLALPAYPRANRLAYRALLAAVKLMQLSAVATPEWLRAQWQAAKHGAYTGPSLDAPLSKDEVMALCLWRNGFRDDLDDGLLAQFQRMLNRLIVDYLPHEERDPDTGAVRHHVPVDSPVVLALGDPMTQAATRRTVTQQSEDHQVAMGRMTRLLVLQLKIAAGLPLRQHEELLRSALVLAEETRKLELGHEGRFELDEELEEILTRLDSVTRFLDVRDGIQSIDPNDLRLLARRLGGGRNPRAIMLDIDTHLSNIRARYSLPIVEILAQPSGHVPPSAHAVRTKILSAVRSSLLANWLICTEFGARAHPYTLTAAVRNAVVSEMADLVDVSIHRPTIEAELSGVAQIDLDLLGQWAYEAGMSAKTPHATSTPCSAFAPGHEVIRRFAHHRDIVMMLRAGRDKTDAGVTLADGPRSREEFRAIAAHRFDGSLGTGSRGAITKAAGARIAFSVDTSPVQMLIPGTPSAGFSFSHDDTLTRTQSFSLIGSSVGGQTLTVSESTGERSQSAAGVTVKGAAAICFGVDGSVAQSGAIELGIALRTPPTPGSRKWVRVGHQAIDVIFGPELSRKLTKDRRGNHAPQKPERALRELCWQCFDRLLDGSLALNVFDNQTASHNFSAGVSVGIGTGVLGNNLAKVSTNSRLSKETDRLPPQSRIDRTGSTRLEIHSVGAASRYNAAVRLILNLLPTKLSEHFRTEISPGTAFGVAVSFRERGVQHFVRRETRDGMTQPSFAWDIVYRDADDLVAHLNTPPMRAHWDALNPPRDGSTESTLDERLQQIRLHARHPNQSYMVRRHLKPEKLADLNAMTALMEGLTDAAAPFGGFVDRIGLPLRCLNLIDDEHNYELGGFGAYTGDHHQTQVGVDGNAIFTETRAVSVATELLWFSARTAAPSPNRMEETGEAGPADTQLQTSTSRQESTTRSPHIVDTRAIMPLTV